MPTPTEPTAASPSPRLRFWRADAAGILPGNRISFSLRIRLLGRVYWMEGSK